MKKIQPGEIVIVVMHSPREKLLGVLQEINASGIFLRGIDLNYFDEWTQAIKSGEAYLPMSDLFFPMWRVERLSRDESSENMPSHAEMFERKTGLALTDF
jgi:hypothetical protein